MSRIAPDCIAAILTETSWMDRLDLTSPSTADRDRAALIIAETIVARLGTDGSDRSIDRDQLPLPI